MKFLLLLPLATAFTVPTGLRTPFSLRAIDMPPSTPAPSVNVRGLAPQDIRYSSFLTNVNDNAYEKVTFSPDGKKLLAVDTEGNRVKIDQLPDDPGLLDMLTVHKVDVTVLPSAPEGGAGGVAGLAQSLVFPAILFAGLFFLSRRGGGEGGNTGGPGGMMGGGNNPMEVSRRVDKMSEALKRSN